MHISTTSISIDPTNTYWLYHFGNVVAIGIVIIRCKAFFVCLVLVFYLLHFNFKSHFISLSRHQVMLYVIMGFRRSLHSYKYSIDDLFFLSFLMFSVIVSEMFARNNVTAVWIHYHSLQLSSWLCRFSLL